MKYMFEKLLVWQKSIEFVRLVYTASKNFPSDERYALTDQLRRAAVSIPSNIAEGNGRTTNRDYAHFLGIARGSLYETLTQLRIAQRLGYADELPEIETLAFEIGNMLGAMLKKYGAIQNEPKTNPSAVHLSPSPNQEENHHCSPSPFTFAFSPKL